MQPRWNETNLRMEGAVFLGGYGRYDMWLLYPHILRVVWGVASSQWDSYYAGNGDGFYHKEDGRPQGGDLDLIFQYIRLFAPDAAKALKLVED